jgi:hypothetical protein
MHAPVPMAAWPLAVTAAVAGVAVGSYLTVLNDRVLADRVLADRVLADRGTGGAGGPHPRGPRGLAGRRPARGTTPRAAGAVPVAGRLLRSGGWDLLVELGTGPGSR